MFSGDLCDGHVCDGNGCGADGETYFQNSQCLVNGAPADGRRTGCVASETYPEFECDQ